MQEPCEASQTSENRRDCSISRVEKIGHLGKNPVRASPHSIIPLNIHTHRENVVEYLSGISLNINISIRMNYNGKHQDSTMYKFETSESQKSMYDNG